jgi:oxaloacetate decarboxylase
MAGDDRRKRFRAVLEGGVCVHPASVHDPISARIAEAIGFEIGMFAGSIASYTVLGAPDIVLLTLTEFAEQARRICRAGTLPLLVDADHGYGNALNVMRTVEELEQAGIAALTIEDTELPRRYGAAAPGLIALDEGVGKMRAALAARRDSALAIIGRTSAAGIAGIGEAITRARAYEAAGVDALFFTGVKDGEELAAIRAAVRLPLILGGGGPADRAVLAAHRVRIALQGHQPFQAAVQAVQATLRALRDGADPATLPGLASSELMWRATRSDEYADWTREFLGG